MSADTLSDQTAERVVGRKIPPRAWLLLIGLTIGWGAMWPLMKIALSEIPLLTLRAGSAGVAGAVMLILSALFGRSLRPVAGEAPKILICAGFNVAIWFYLSAVGVSLLPAGRATLLAYTMPVWAFLIGVVFLKERVTLRRVAGVMAGLSAVLTLGWEDLVAGGGDSLPFGILAMLAAALTWSIGSTLQKSFAFQTRVSVYVGWQLLLGSIPLFVLAFSIDSQDWIQTVTWKPLAAAATITLISQAFGLWSWSMILKLTDVGFASIAVLSVPMASQILSFLFLGEIFGPVEAAGLGFITFGLATLLPLDGLKRRILRSFSG